MDNNKIKVYNYVKRNISKNMINSIIFMSVSYFLLITALFISVSYDADAPMFIGSVAIISILCMLMSVYLNIKECKKNKVAYRESCICFILTIFYVIVWFYGTMV